MFSKLTIKIPKWRHWRRSGIFIVNFEHISHLVLVFLLLALNMQLPAGNTVAIVNWVAEKFQLDSVKFDSDGEKRREAIGTGNCSINIWDGSELELGLPRKSSLYFGNVFLILLSSGISNITTFKLHDVLHWVIFLKINEI